VVGEAVVHVAHDGDDVAFPKVGQIARLVGVIPFRHAHVTQLRLQGQPVMLGERLRGHQRLVGVLILQEIQVCVVGWLFRRGTAGRKVTVTDVQARDVFAGSDMLTRRLGGQVVGAIRIQRYDAKHTGQRQPSTPVRAQSSHLVPPGNDRDEIIRNKPHGVSTSARGRA
jgi:hypothetical protein